jgi:hypothetical protein
MPDRIRLAWSAVLRRAPLLFDFAPRFLEWVDHARHLAPKSRRYYRVGWNRIRSTPLMGMNLDRITTEALDSLSLVGSPSYVNQAIVRQGGGVESDCRGTGCQADEGKWAVS